MNFGNIFVEYVKKLLFIREILVRVEKKIRKKIK